MASSQALAKRNNDSSLMPPPPPPKRIKRPPKVLDEDDYTDTLSRIIARDFFPGLAETHTQQEYLDALEAKDKAWIESAGRRLTQVMTPGPDGRRARGRRGVSITPVGGVNIGDTPQGWGGDTPMSVAASDITTASRASQKEEIDTNLSLSAFQAKYTSEDNESFNELLDNQNIKRREKYAWMWNGNKVPSARQIAHRQREQKLLTSRADSDAQTKMNKEYENRPAKPDSWKSRPDNQLMFIPSTAIEDTHLESVQDAAEKASRAGPKTVVYDNTRFPPPSNPEPSVPPSPSLSAIQDAIAGRPRPTASEAAYDGSETPRVNGYAFVDSEEPEPELMYAPPIKLSTGDATPNPFKISENRKREDLHHRMVEKAARKKRTEKIESETKTPVPKFPSSPFVGTGRTPGARPATSNAPLLTPAAQRLLNKVGKTPIPRAGREESGLKNSWTPTPKVKRK
jgi:protein DGCR14